jgi:hypothetical protein
MKETKIEIRTHTHKNTPMLLSVVVVVAVANGSNTKQKKVSLFTGQQKIATTACWKDDACEVILAMVAKK